MAVFLPNFFLLFSSGFGAFEEFVVATAKETFDLVEGLGSVGLFTASTVGMVAMRSGWKIILDQISFNF